MYIIWADSWPVNCRHLLLRPSMRPKISTPRFLSGFCRVGDVGAGVVRPRCRRGASGSADRAERRRSLADRLWNRKNERPASSSSSSPSPSESSSKKDRGSGSGVNRLRDRWWLTAGCFEISGMRRYASSEMWLGVSGSKGVGGRLASDVLGRNISKRDIGRRDRELLGRWSSTGAGGRHEWEVLGRWIPAGVDGRFASDVFERRGSGDAVDFLSGRRGADHGPLTARGSGGKGKDANTAATGDGCCWIQGVRSLSSGRGGLRGGSLSLEHCHEGTTGFPGGGKAIGLGKGE